MKISTILLLALALPSLAFGQTPDAAKPSAETEKELMKMEQDMSNALIKGDAATVEKMIAEDCFLTAPDGTTQNKAQFMADVKSGDLKLAVAKNSRHESSRRQCRRGFRDLCHHGQGKLQREGHRRAVSLDGPLCEA